MNIELQLKVQDLNVRYAQAIDDNHLEAWPDFFTEDGRYRVTTAENFERGLPLHRVLTEAIVANDAARAEAVSRQLVSMPYQDLAGRLRLPPALTLETDERILR